MRTAYLKDFPDKILKITEDYKYYTTDKEISCDKKKH